MFLFVKCLKNKIDEHFALSRNCTSICSEYLPTAGPKLFTTQTRKYTIPIYAHPEEKANKKQTEKKCIKTKRKLCT